MKKYILSITMTCIAECSCLSVVAQTTVTLDDAIEQALTKNKRIEAASLDVEYQEHFKRTLNNIGKTNVEYMRGQYNSYEREDNNFTILQTIPFPTVFTSQNTLGKSLIKASELRKAVSENELAYQVKQVYYQLLYLSARKALLTRLDSLYGNFVKSADLRYQTGETRLLEKAIAEAQQNESRNQLTQVNADFLIYQKQLGILMNRDEPVIIVVSPLTERSPAISIDSLAVSQNPQLGYLNQQIEIASNEKKVAVAKFLPDITVGYFNQTLIGTPIGGGELATSDERFQGFQVGLSIPLWFGPYSAKSKAAAISHEKAQAEFEYNQDVMEGQWQQTVQEYIKNKSSISYYETSAIVNAELILRQSGLAFQNGEIDYTEYLLTVKNAVQIQEGYIRNLNELNQSTITLEFLAGVK